MDNKQVLKDYIDACELVKTITQTNVKGSNPDFPYQEQHFQIKGTTFTYQDDKNLRYEEKLLEERKERAEQIKLQAQAVINRAPVRIQRIIRMRYMENMSWDAIAAQIGRGATKDSLRMEFDRFLLKK